MKKFVLDKILDAWKNNLQNKEKIKYLSNLMFIFETQKGLPAEVFLDKLRKNDKELNKEREMLIIDGYLGKIIQHKIKSGCIQKNIEKQREINIKKLYNFIIKNNFDTI